MRKGSKIGLKKAFGHTGEDAAIPLSKIHASTRFSCYPFNHLANTTTTVQDSARSSASSELIIAHESGFILSFFLLALIFSYIGLDSLSFRRAKIDWHASLHWERCGDTGKEGV